MSRRSAVFTCCLYLSLCWPTASAAPRIVTSIEPLRDLVASVAQTLASVENLIPGQSSPHHFAFRPSQLVLLQNADLVIWIDRRFEGGFDRIDSLSPATASQLELGPALALEADQLHLWYSPRLLRASAGLISERLSKLDPQNAETYQRNNARLETAIGARDSALREQLQHSGALLLLTDHAFLEAFADEYDQIEIHALRDRHEGSGSLGDLRRLERLLETRPAGCLLTSESAPSPLGAELARKHEIPVISLRPESRNSMPGQPLRHLDRLLEALGSCTLQR